MDWMTFEIDLIVEDYFAMLLKELKGIDYNKSAHRKALAIRLNERSKGSVEFKHQNISAVLIKHGLPYIRGYKPRWNYQQLLEEKLFSYLQRNSGLENDFDRFANQDLNLDLSDDQFNKLIVPAPESKLFQEPEVIYHRKGVKRNYLELEQRNQSIGQAGEKLIYDYEIWRLKNSDNPDLSRKVEWISQQDDGAGFDILSKNLDGADIFIEVKSTTLGKETPIFFSKNENDFSIQRQDQFHLYRVFALNQNPRVFIRQGNFEKYCSIEPVSFKGYF